MKPLRQVMLGLVPLIVLLLLWQIGIRFVERGEFFYGSPSTVIGALWTQAASGKLLLNTWFTLSAVVSGFIIGNLLGIIFGSAMSYNRTLSTIINPYLVILGSVPAMAFAPMIILWFGIGLASKIALAAFSTAIVGTIQVFQGAQQTPQSAIALLESLGASRWEVFTKVISPSSLVWLFSGLKLNIGVAILAVFIGEFISAQAGLGYQIVIDMGLFKTSQILAGVVAIAFMSLVLTKLITILQRRVMPWTRVKS